MIIDWYTIIFQIINFMILVFLLRRFLYRPIIRAMDEREQKIVQREQDAEAKKQEAEQETRSYRQKKEELEQEEEEILEQARLEAEQEKRGLLDAARREVDEKRQRWEEAFEREKDSFIGELRRRIGMQACLVARRCLEDLADSRLEEITWDLFLEKLSRLPEDDRLNLQKGLSADEHKAVLSTAFETPEKKISQLASKLREVVPGQDRKLNISAKTDPNLICGLELDAGGFRLAWNVESYLGDVEQQVLQELGQHFPARDHDPGGEAGEDAAEGRGGNSRKEDEKEGPGRE